MSAWWRRLRWWILACIKVVTTRLPYLNRSFVILSSGRSGSTLLVQLLNTNRQIACAKELLNRELLDQYQLKGADERTLTNYLLSMLLPMKLWLPYTGFKLFNEQLEYCKLSLRQVIQDLNFPPVIVLYRENLLETYVSLKIAFQTDVWYSEKQVNKYSVMVDWEDFYQYAEDERMRWKKSLSALGGVKKILVTFDQLTGGQQGETMHRLFGFLNLTTNCPITAASSVRQNPLPLEKKVLNYHEIMERVRETGYPIMMKLNLFAENESLDHGRVQVNETSHSI